MADCYGNSKQIQNKKGHAILTDIDFEMKKWHFVSLPTRPNTLIQGKAWENSGVMHQYCMGMLVVQQKTTQMLYQPHSD